MRHDRPRPTAFVAVLAFVMAAITVVSIPAPPGTASARDRPTIESHGLDDGPVRLADTRATGQTVDGGLAGIGRRPAGGELVVPVDGRAGLSASTVAVNVTMIATAEPGHITIYPCDEPRPATSNQFAPAGETRAVLAVVELAADGTLCVYNRGATHLAVDLVATFDGEVTASATPSRLLDTRAGGDPIPSGESAVVRVAGLAEVPDGADVALVGVTAIAQGEPGHALAHGCSEGANVSTLNYVPGRAIANLAFVALDDDGDACVSVVGDAHLVVDVFGWADDADVVVPGRSARLLDTRPGKATVDGSQAGIGVLARRSTTTLQVAGRSEIPDDVGAVLLNVTAVSARAPGHLSVYASGAARPTTSNLNVDPGETIANAVVTQVGADGDVCLYSHDATDLVVDVVGWLPASTPAPGEGGCDPDSLFPEHRVVALYGNDVAAELGVLGEQPPDAAADRLADIAEPYRAGDRPVLEAFELIATIATSAPGPSGLYRSPSSPEHVQRYLDAANDHDLELILDIQPGRGDFLTELQRYESFLREPNVHAALDPEWNVGPGQVPGEVVGQVSALEVNEVADYLAGIVAEEGLPEKMLVVHQFQDRMLTDEASLRSPDGVAVNIHMDGFGTQSQKLSTYSVVQVEPPFWNGFKLFFDEDIDRFTAAEVLALDPAPDLITYQ